MLPPRHGYLENTIASMEAAFSLGADALELDAHPTTDGQFAIFHDCTVDCRTEGRGRTRDHDMATLKTLDIGHGYTADGGKTFPFRGKGVGLMPTLTEVLQRFPDRRFQRQEQRCEALAAFLAALDAGRRSRPTVYGGDEPVDVVKRLLPGMRVFSRRTVKACAKAYAGLGWSGYVAEACRGSATLMIPTNVAPWLWG